MGKTKAKTKPAVFKPGGFISGQKFTLDDQLLIYRNAYGKLPSRAPQSRP